MNARQRVAVVGSGISGLTAAYILQQQYDVTLFEKENWFGGHAHTYTTDDTAIDTGFIVYNKENYPNFCRLLKELKVKSIPTTMSMSVVCHECHLYYAGGKGIRGLLPSLKTCTDMKYLRMLWEIKKFHKEARKTLKNANETVSLENFILKNNFTAYFQNHFLQPLIKAVWSCDSENAMKYPANNLFVFLQNHGMLKISNPCKWQTIENGSQEYVNKLVPMLSGLKKEEILKIKRSSTSVEVETAKDIYFFSKVVVAVHPDTALKIVKDLTFEEENTLEKFQYSKNKIILHKDDSLLQKNKRIQSAWNYQQSKCDARKEEPRVDYYMNLLQSLKTNINLFISLNAEIPKETILAEFYYEHPIFTKETSELQKTMNNLGSNTLAFAGAWQGWGFHEDGCKSGVEAAKKLGVAW